MRNLIIILTVITLYSCNNMNVTPPIAKKVEKKLEIHNDVRIDNYYWLNQRENPEVVSYLDEENNYKEAKLKSTERFQKNLFEEMKSRIKEDDNSVPYFLNDYSTNPSCHNDTDGSISISIFSLAYMYILLPSFFRAE